MFDLEKNAAVLIAGVAIGVAGHGLVSDVWKATPWSAESKLDRTRDQLKDVTAQAAAEGAARRLRDAEIAKRDAGLITYAAQAGVDQTATVDRWSQQCLAAYRSGVTFGRASAQPRTPGDPGHAPHPVPDPARQPAAGVVRPSFRDDWAAGAFDPARSTGAGGRAGAGGRPPDR